MNVAKNALRQIMVRNEFSDATMRVDVKM
ncbi:MAG: hypothetical protein ACJAUH_001421 [Saprospiraceae bacterium]|jgi:hypothetical protein